MSTAHVMRLPAELRQRPQWLLAAPNNKGELKIPTSVSATGALVPGSSTDPGTWLEFDYALECAQEHGYALGYVLSNDDPFTCVDFDVKNVNNLPHDPSKWTSEADLTRMRMLVEDLASYTEQSVSGQGVHVWVRAKFEGSGLKRSGVEVYCRERFIVCTGRHIHAPALPVVERQDEITQLVQAMRDAQAASGVERAQALYSSEQELPDEEVMRRAWNADNAEKFRALWGGQWQDLGYPSQSEADLSLMSMLTFYSRDNEQCCRLFRQSGLGMRDKAVKDDRYLNYTLRLIRGRQAKEDAMQAQAEAAARAFADVALAAKAPPAPGAAAGAPPAPGAAVEAAGGLAAPVALDWPPGRAGDIARFIFNSAPRPVKEVAIVGTLGLLAGICGKAWVIPGSGLNCYIILVARSAIGKEAMHSGLGALLHRVQQSVPGAVNFVTFADFASGPALAKACATQASFVNVNSEFGRKLKGMSLDNSGPLQSLRTTMTALYQKSGPTSLVGGINYSNKDNNVGSVTGVAFSLVGETTPDTLYESLTDSMMSDGFLSRFTIIEHVGIRPPANRNPEPFPSNELTQALCDLCMQALTLINNAKTCPVLRDADAARLMDAFDEECDAEINGSENEAWRQMWNRAHLKMLRLAALLAVADAPQSPIVTAAHVTWALDVIRRDIGVMRRRIASGDIGADDHTRFLKLASILREYLKGNIPEGYGVPHIMPRDGVVPWKYMQMRSASVSSFKSHKLGAKRALEDAVKSMVDSGYLVEMDKAKAGEQYTFQGRCFRIVSLPPL